MEVRSDQLLLGRYRTLFRLGAGGMGEVWSATDTKRHLKVAIKVVRPDLLDEVSMALFRTEILTAAQLDHPSIPKVFDLAETPELTALVMELRPGQSLAQLSPLSFDKLLAVTRGVLSALAYSHSMGFLHLDLKPQNILLATDDAKESIVTLLDFGVSRRWRGLSRERGGELLPRVLLGTVPFMAPEQLESRSHQFGPWTDFFGLGATLYYLLTGAKPFQGKSAASRMQRPPLLVVSDLPEAYLSFVHSLLAPDFRDRPTHAADLLSLLAKLEGSNTLAVARPERKEDEQSTNRNKVSSALANNDESTARTLAPKHVQRVSTRPPILTQAPRYSPSSGPIPTSRLLGLSHRATAGRTSEGNLLWKKLYAVTQNAEFQLVQIRGPSGAGKSRLAKDLMQRAHRAGMAHIAATAWTAGGAGNEGISRLLGELVGFGDAPKNQLRVDIARWAIRHPGGDDLRFTRETIRILQPGLGLVDPILASQVCAEAAYRLANTRALVLWLDDSHKSNGASSALLQTLCGFRAPILVLTTSTSTSPIALELLESRSTDMQLAPMSAMDAEQYTLQTLPLRLSLAKEVVAISQGNLRFLQSLLQYFVQCEQLEETPSGLKLKSTAMSLPQNQEATWVRLLDYEKISHNTVGGLALCRARLENSLLEEIVEEAPEVIQAVQGALRLGFLVRQQEHYEWKHEGLRQFLINQMGEESRSNWHHRAATLLTPLLGSEDVAPEVAAHWHGACDIQKACQMQSEAIRWSHQHGNEKERLLRSIVLKEWSEQNDLSSFRIVSLAEIAHAQALLGNLRDANKTLNKASKLELAMPEKSARLHLRIAQVAVRAREDKKAESETVFAMKIAEAEGDSEIMVEALGVLGLAAHRRRDIEGAFSLFDRAAILARERGDSTTEARALAFLANLSPTQELHTFSKALEAALNAGARTVELQIRQMYADALYLAGQSDRAYSQMAIVVERAKALGLRQLCSVSAIQQACWALREGTVQRAREYLADAIDAGAQKGARVEQSMVLAIDAACFSLEGNPNAVQERLAKLDLVRGDFDSDELRELLAMAEALPTLSK